MGFREEVLKRIDKARDLPTLPGVFAKLDKIIANKNSSASNVAALMKDDIALTARVLKVANSAAFCGSTKISSVSQAISRLGFQQMSEITKSLSLASLFKGAGVVDLKKFWRHSFSVASATEIIPRYLGKMPADRDSLFTAGLLHDVGIFVLELFTGDLYRSIASQAEDTKRPLHLVEQEMMRIDHAEIGAIVLHKWNIPEPVIEAAKHHHEPYEPAKGAISLSDTVKLANIICNDQGAGNGINVVAEKLSEEDWDKYGVKASDVPALAEEILKTVEKSTTMLAASE